jgi:hypothetical protein
MRPFNAHIIAAMQIELAIAGFFEFDAARYVMPAQAG